MTTRGVTNEEIRRRTCRVLAEHLARENDDDDEKLFVEKFVKPILIKWLEAIADGADPRDVILRRSHRNDLSGTYMAVLVESLIKGGGMSQGAALRSVAEGYGFPEDTVEKTYKSYRDSLTPDHFRAARVGFQLWAFDHWNELSEPAKAAFVDALDVLDA